MLVDQGWRGEFNIFRSLRRTRLVNVMASRLQACSLRPREAHWRWWRTPSYATHAISRSSFAARRRSFVLYPSEADAFFARALAWLIKLLEGDVCLVPFWNRRPRRGGYNGGDDVSGPGSSPCPRCAEPPDIILSAGHDSHLRRPAGADAPWPRSMAAAAGNRPDWPAGLGVKPLA
jgi:hypothetical protein